MAKRPKKVGSSIPSSTDGAIALYDGLTGDTIKQAIITIQDILGRIGGIKIVPVSTTETIGANFESIVMKKQTINGTLIILGQNTIL